MRGEQHTAVANLVGAHPDAELSQSSGEWALTLDAIVNLRVEAAPHVLHDAFTAAFDAWTSDYGLAVLSGSGQCFSPALRCQPITPDACIGRIGRPAAMVRGDR